MDIGYRLYNRIRNVGDAITPYVLEELTGFRACSVSHELPHVLGIGSIFFMATEYSYIWGSGILNPRSHIPPVSRNRIKALRGKRTAELLASRGIAMGDVPLGDPGIFASDVMNGTGTPSEAPKYRAAVLPHHSSITHPFYQRIKDSVEFCLVNVLDDTLRSLFQIAEADVVISQSLHGLVFAESLGKPSVWISEQTSPDWQFKFEDWFSTTANPQNAPLPLTADVDVILGAAEQRASTIDKVALKQALPIASVIHELGTPLDFRRCRQFAPISVSLPTLFAGNLYGSYQELKERVPGASFAAFSSFSEFFASWAERAYLCLQPEDADVQPSHGHLRTMCQWLDHNLEPDFAYIVSRSALVEKGSKLREIGNNVALVEAPTVLGGAVLLRPDFGGLKDRYVTFCV